VPVDSNGNPWQGSYITASGNLLADFTANANAEMQGRVQVARIYNMTDDHGVRDLLSFLLARDTMHQNQWIAAAQELREEGVEDLPVPINFPLSQEAREVSYYLDGPDTTVPMPPPTQPDPRFFGTDARPNLVDKAAGVVKDKLSEK